MDMTCATQLANTSVSEHQLVVTVDNGPFLISFMVDGILCDGGTESMRGTCWMTNDVSQEDVLMMIFPDDEILMWSFV